MDHVQIFRNTPAHVAIRINGGPAGTLGESATDIFSLRVRRDR